MTSRLHKPLKFIHYSTPKSTGNSSGDLFGKLPAKSNGNSSLICNDSNQSPLESDLNFENEFQHLGNSYFEINTFLSNEKNNHRVLFRNLSYNEIQSNLLNVQEHNFHSYHIYPSHLYNNISNTNNLRNKNISCLSIRKYSKLFETNKARSRLSSDTSRIITDIDTLLKKDQHNSQNHSHIHSDVQFDLLELNHEHDDIHHTSKPLQQDKLDSNDNNSFGRNQPSTSKDRKIKNDFQKRKNSGITKNSNEIQHKHDAYVDIDKILHDNPKKSLLHYRLLYICGDEKIHQISFRKKVFNRILEACVAQNNFDFGKKFFYKYFTLSRNINDEQQLISQLPISEFDFDGHRNALGLGRWNCPECSTLNSTNVYKCISCDSIRDEFLEGKDYFINLKMKSVKIELMKLDQSLSEEEEITLRNEILKSTNDEDYFPDIPQVKANYDTFHLYANLCARSNNSDELLNLLDLMSANGWNPSIGIYISLLRLHVENGNHQAFFDSFDQFFKDGGLEPDVATLRLLSRVLRAEKAVSDLENLFEHMLRNHSSQTQNIDTKFKVTSSTIPRSKLDWKQFHLKLDVVILNDLLGLYSDIGESKSLLEVLDNYVQKSDSSSQNFKIEPTINTFNYALRATADISDGENFDRVWKEMKAWSLRKPQIKPNTLTYNALLRLYKGINATSYISEILTNYFQTSPNDSNSNHVPPDEETWKILLETFHSKIETLNHISTWMNRFDLLPKVRFHILLLGLHIHLESSNPSSSSINFLNDIFERYNRFGHPLNEEATILLCKILLKIEELNFYEQKNTSYWEMSTNKLIIRSIEKDTLKDETFQSLLNLGRADYNEWKKMISNSNHDHQEFCKDMIKLYYMRNNSKSVEETV